MRIKTIRALQLLMALVSLPALAQQQAAAPATSPAQAPASPFSFNIAVVSDYRVRGISQTRLKPALQAGVDYADPSGFYVGAFASNIKWIKDLGGKASIEVDIYGGYKGEIAKDVSLDVGVIRYQYSNNNLTPDANTNEVYVGMGYGVFSAKYSHSISTFLGFLDSKNSNYLEVNANPEIAKQTTLVLHAGHQNVRGGSDASYSDYALGLAYDLDGFILSATALGTNAQRIPYTSPIGNRFIAKNGLVLGVKKTF
jgi:uncharacterized protein (TIGR02001 family)